MMKDPMVRTLLGFAALVAYFSPYGFVWGVVMFGALELLGFDDAKDMTIWCAIVALLLFRLRDEFFEMEEDK